MRPVAPKADFWVAEGDPETPRVHIAFRAKTREEVDAFYKAAMAAGGRDNGPPGIRAHYHEHYYVRPAPVPYYAPPPPPPHWYHGGWNAPRYGYDDGVTIIFKGRLN